MGLAETEGGEGVGMTGYEWYIRNRDGGKQASRGVAVYIGMWNGE